jgi:hypothetical protein
MIGACKPTVWLPDDAVDVFQKDILNPADQVSFYTTPPYHPFNGDHPAPHGAASSLSLAMLDVISKDIINPY